MTTRSDLPLLATLVNGLRADLHDVDCDGMDEDGNWLGPCKCAEEFPVITWTPLGHNEKRQFCAGCHKSTGVYGDKVVVEVDGYRKVFHFCSACYTDWREAN